MKFDVLFVTTRTLTCCENILSLDNQCFSLLEHRTDQALPIPTGGKMNYLALNEKTGTYEVRPGTKILWATLEAIVIADKFNQLITYTFNEVVITVAGNSNPYLIERDYHRARKGCFKEVNPFPKENLSFLDKVFDFCMETKHRWLNHATRRQYV